MTKSSKNILVIIAFLGMKHIGFTQINDSLRATLPGSETYDSEMQLSDMVPETNLGLWQKGDYNVYVPIDGYEKNLKESYESLVKAIKELPETDSTNRVRYQLYIDRYALALEQINKAENGFDLKTLVVYIGPENIKDKEMLTSDVNLYVQKLVQEGQAIVYYKGQRIYRLKIRYTMDVIMSTYTYYYDTPSNSIFNYYGYINW
jgi:hypothetical protein